MGGSGSRRPPSSALGAFRARVTRRDRRGKGPACGRSVGAGGVAGCGAQASGRGGLGSGVWGETAWFDRRETRAQPERRPRDSVPRRARGPRNLGPCLPEQDAAGRWGLRPLPTFPPAAADPWELSSEHAALGLLGGSIPTSLTGP